MAYYVNDNDFFPKLKICNIFSQKFVLKLN